MNREGDFEDLVRTLNLLMKMCESCYTELKQGFDILYKQV